VLRQNTKRLFRILWNPARIKTGRRIIYTAFQCHAGSYRTTSKPTNNRYNLQQRKTTTRICRLYIDIVGRSQSAVRDAYLALEGEAAKVGLKINEQKTKYMIATIRDVGQSVAIGDKHFEVVKEFVYLGSLMTPANDVSLEVQRRI
jgi:hypothetical protein